MWGMSTTVLVITKESEMSVRQMVGRLFGVQPAPEMRGERSFDIKPMPEPGMLALTYSRSSHTPAIEQQHQVLHIEDVNMSSTPCGWPTSTW